MKFYGPIGYGETVENPPGSGVWVDVISERNHYGDVVRNTRREQVGEYLNAGLTLSNVIRVVADAYLMDHMHQIRYVQWQTIRWHVISVEVERPRLSLTLGGVYNGPTPE